MLDAPDVDPLETVAPAPAEPSRRIGALELLAGALILVAVARPLLADALSRPVVQTWATLFVSLSVQALPFLVLGVCVSAAIAVLVPAEWFARALPRRPVLAVPAAGLAGVMLPGCECGSVPIAGNLVSRGVVPAGAFAFLLAAPAVNPAVLVSTAVAFPGRPAVVVARFLASLVTSVGMGWLWLRFGRAEWLVQRLRHAHLPGRTKAEAFAAAARHDFLHAGGFLVVGALTAATLNVVVPRSVLDSVAASGPVAVLALAGLAVILAICSEADAFVAASLGSFSMTARLAFMVVGPAVDVKLVALQVGTFGRAFALRFAPATFVVAVASSVLFGWWLL